MMAGTNVTVEELFMKPYQGDIQKKLQKIQNIKALLEHKCHLVRDRIEEMFKTIKMELFHDLFKVLNLKRKYLEEIEMKVTELRSSVTEGTSQSVLNTKEMELIDIQILGLLSLEFVPNVSNSIYHIGYIRTTPTKPDDLSLELEMQKFEIGTYLEAKVKSKKPWHFMTLNSLSGYAEDVGGEKILPKIVDNKDGSYIFYFNLNSYSKYTIQVTLYGHPIKDSPCIVETEPVTRNDRYVRQETPSPRNKELLLEETWSNSSYKTCQNEECHQPHLSTSLTTSCRNNKVYIDMNDDRFIEDKDDDYSVDYREDNLYNRKTECSDMKLEGNDDDLILKANLLTTVGVRDGVELHFPIGVAVNHNNDTIICDTGHHMVWIVNGDGKLKQKIQQKKKGENFFRPSAVVVMEDDSLVIKDSTGLHLYNKDGIFIRSIGETVLQRPFGLAITEDQKLITLNETRKSDLFVFNKDGGIENRNLYEPLMKRHEKSKCRFLAYYSNEVVVSDLGLSVMYKTTVDGKLIKTFGTFGNIEGTMNEPSGIALDPTGTMLIGDSRNDRIQVFDWEGEYIGKVTFSHPIRRPSDITLTKDGRLYVLNYLNHHLAIYALKIE
ncbi:tripartite motif-containing protein 2-like [Centruroides vittatus]|uniref:tripartite motif-containing protein 2-like n=1 Tax=Centruroides vittatus TaxID=120091 RepID=UPI00350F9B19